MKIFDESGSMEDEHVSEEDFFKFSDSDFSATNYQKILDNLPSDVTVKADKYTFVITDSDE